MEPLGELFHRVVNVDAIPAALAEARTFATRQFAMRETPVPARATLRDALAELPDTDARCGDAASVLVAYAPSGLLDGCWLARASSAATHHTELGTRMLRLYAHEIDHGGIGHHGNLYRAMAASAGVTLPAVGSPKFGKLAVPEAAYRLALAKLCAGLFPRDFAPELVGCSLFAYARGVPAPLRKLAVPDTRYVTAHAVQGPQLAQAIELVELVDDWPRVWNAVRTLHDLDSAWLCELANPRAPSLRQRMVELVRAKAPIGHGYHKARTLDGEAIDSLLDPHTLDPEAVLARLAREPDRLLAATEFGGPMFRVFSPDELQTIRDWIASLTVRDPDGPDVRVPSAVTRLTNRPVALGPGAKRARDLFHVLVNADLDDAAAAYAHRHAERCFSRAERWQPWWPNRYQRYFAYEPARFEAWCDARHRWQVERYEPPGVHPMLSRDQCIWLLTQLAPFTLVDGCWLQCVACLGTDVSGTLFRIYYDEVGNGDVALNHANVYRAMMADVGVTVPAVDSLQLALWPVLVGAAFELPTLWLAVSHATRRFFPELLGLNLGIEFAGIGGGYMGFSDLLRKHGIEPTIIDLHNSIDNLSTGHTAWARDAINDYLERVRSEAGDAAVQTAWRRIWTGTRAHDLYFSRFERACTIRLAPGVLRAVIARKLRRQRTTA